MIIGRKIRNFFKWPALGLIVHQEKCSHCQLCTKNCSMSLDVHQMVTNGYIENVECILCGNCVDVCPENVIHFSFSGIE